MCVSGDVSISVIDCSAKLLPVCAECQKQYRKFWNQWDETSFRSSLSLGNTVHEPALFLLFSQARDIYKKERPRLNPRTVFVRAAELHLLLSGLLIGFTNTREHCTHWLWRMLSFACFRRECLVLIVTEITRLFSCADYFHSIRRELGRIMNHKQFYTAFFTMHNFYLISTHYGTSRNNQHYAMICTTPLLYILAPTCFGNSVPS
jgi:hypothetical protein